jgi:hypothetical protein
MKIHILIIGKRVHTLSFTLADALYTIGGVAAFAATGVLLAWPA